MAIIAVLSIFAPKVIEALKPPPSSQISITHAEFDRATQSILVPIINTGQSPSNFVGAAFINEDLSLGFLLNVDGDGIKPLGPGLSELRLRQEVRLNNFANFTELSSQLEAEGLGESKNNILLIFYRENDGTVAEIQTSISNGNLLGFVNANAVVCSEQKDGWREMFDLGPIQCSDLNGVAFDGGLGSVEEFRQYARNIFLDGG